MKQEKITKLLAGTKYEAIADPSARPMPENWQHALDELHDDAALNAARVQLLAKALYWIEAWLVGEADTMQGISRKDAAQRVRAALAEAEVNP